MLEGISQIKDKVHNAVFDRNGYTGFDVEAVVANLRKDPKFKKFTDAQLYEYAYGLNEVHNMHALRGALDSMGYNTGKPKDPFWSQYTYEEILNMVNDGVTVPQEFIDWAHTMQDSDTVAYQIEGATDDENAYDNLAAETGNIQKTDIQKRAQAFASKAQAQQELIENQCEAVKPTVNQVLSEKNELEKNQKMSLKRIDEITSEWKTLDTKFKNGKELTESEQKKYQQLGLMLNDSNNNLMLQAKKVSGDIEDLMNQISNIDMLLNVNERINAEIEDVGTRMASFEGSKRHIILPASSGNQVTGITAAFYAGAMGNNLAFDTGLTGINLFFSNLEVEHDLDSHVNLVNTSTEQVEIAANTADKRDENTKSTTNKQAENQGDDKKTDDNNNIGAPDYKTENTEEPENTTSPSQPAAPENETNTVTGFADIVNESAKDNGNAKAALQSQTASNVLNTAPATLSAAPADTTTAASAQTSETNETAETTETESATETTENTETSVETEDPLQAETSQYVSECANRNQSMQQAEQQIQPKIEQIKNVKARQKQEDARAKAELEKSLGEYEKLADKVKNGDELTQAEQQRVKVLEKSLDSKNGTLIAEMRGKVNALTGFAAELQNDILATVDNQKYGEEAIAKGKECAIAMYGDKSYLQDSMYGFMSFQQLSKEEQYDLLYGKAGESIGRDAIDNGELLVSNAAASNAKLSKSLPLAGFAENYADELNKRIAETNKRTNSVKTNLMQSAQQTESEHVNDGTAKGKETENKEVTKQDGDKVKQQGNEAKKEGKEAKKDGQEAKKDKQATDKQIKQETAALKSDAKRIKNYTKDSQEINKQFEEMSIETEAIMEAQSQASSENTQPSPQAGPAMALNSTAAHAAGGASLNAAAGSDNSQSDNTAKLQSLAEAVPSMEKRLKTNDKTIKSISKSTQTKTKKLNKLYKLKYKNAQADIKAKEDKVKKNEKLQGTITKTGYAFTGTKMTGLALMAFPWSHLVGEFMYGLGKYGEITCYVANAAIDVANGNFLGAVVNVGAAALSYFTGPAQIGPAQGAVTEAATEGAKEVGKETGKELIKEGGTQAGAELIKDGGTQVGTEILKDSGASVGNTLMQTSTGSLAALAGNGTELAMQGAGEMMKETSKNITQQLAKEAAKQALKDTVKSAIMNAATAAMPQLIAMTHKPNTDNDMTEKKKSRRLLTYQEKRSRQARMDKIEKTKKVLMARAHR